MKRVKRIGILTAGGDCPGLNAAIRGVGKAVLGPRHGSGRHPGRFSRARRKPDVPLDRHALAGILTVGGTMLGTSRVKPHRMEVGGRVRDMRDRSSPNYARNRLDALVCIGGGGTQKNALRLVEKGLNVITLPKTIDNDVAMTDATFGFDTALGIATEAIDRLHSTAHSHHRIIVAEIMGHRAGWLALGAGIAGGADVILIPEIPYSVKKIAKAIRRRSQGGTNFSIVAVAEGALSQEDAGRFRRAKARKARAHERGGARADARGAGRARTAPRGEHAAAGARAGGAHPARIPRDHPGLRPARRHAVGRRPPAGHPARHGLRRPDRGPRFRRHGRGARRRHQSRCRSRRSPANARPCRSITPGLRRRAQWELASATERS